MAEKEYNSYRPASIGIIFNSSLIFLLVDKKLKEISSFIDR